jgi:hypothetical protein
VPSDRDPSLKRARFVPAAECNPIQAVCLTRGVPPSSTDLYFNPTRSRLQRSRRKSQCVASLELLLRECPAKIAIRERHQR